VGGFSQGIAFVWHLWCGFILRPLWISDYRNPAQEPRGWKSAEGVLDPADRQDHASLCGVFGDHVFRLRVFYS
jgi:hypothetical protein